MTIESLEAYGANVKEGLARCLNNESFYLRLVGKCLGDANFDRLRDSVAAGDAKGAFEASHALKGSTGNLAITPIFDPVCELTEKLRGMTMDESVKTLTEEVLSQLEKARSL